MMISFIERVEIIVGKGEDAGNITMVYPYHNITQLKWVLII